MRLYYKVICQFIACASLVSCSSTIDRLKNVGSAPSLTKMHVPVNEMQIAEVKIAPAKRASRIKNTNSLWQPGSTTFFRDTRAWQVGDILQVTVAIQDSAQLSNTTSQSRNGADNVNIKNLYGREKIIAKALKATSLAPILSDTSTHSYKGNGGVSRNESVTTQIAATVEQVLPNGNLVIQGHQEVRVNNELREIKIVGVIRPKDIAADNSIKSGQIAEARISYGGRGVVSDMQQPRVGAQIVDILSPF